MIGGFALAAAPADYRVTGVKTFIVSYDGIVYEKDLGPKTLEQFRAMETLQPGQDVDAGRGAVTARRGCGSARQKPTPSANTNVGLFTSGLKR